MSAIDVMICYLSTLVMLIFILDIKGSDYCCIFSGITKNEAKKAEHYKTK